MKIALLVALVLPLCRAVSPPVAAWRAYGSALAKYPLRTQMASSAVIWGLGDVTAQCLVPRQTQHASTKGWHAESGGAAKREAVKLERTAKQVAYASLVWTPVASFWYKLLETVACKVARQGTAKFVGTKVALEIVAFHPISLAAYFGCLGFAQGDGVPVIEDKFRRDFLPTLAGEILLWTPLDMCLFALVPVRFQLLVVDTGCFLESVALSWVNAHGIQLPSCLRH